MPAAPTLNATTAHNPRPPGMPPIAVGRFLQLYATISTGEGVNRRRFRAEMRGRA